jgi:hypothetical protein
MAQLHRDMGGNVHLPPPALAIAVAVAVAFAFAFAVAVVVAFVCFVLSF